MIRAHCYRIQCIYIADHNTATHRFDLCEDGMIRFVHFLKGLGKHAEELKARFDSVREQLVERICTEHGRASLRWTLRSQLDEYDLWPEADDDDDEVARYEDVMKRAHEEERARYERFMS